MTVNANAVTRDPTGVVPSAADTVKFGVSYTNSQPFTGYIRQITYIPRRISNAELQRQTA